MRTFPWHPLPANTDWCSSMSTRTRRSWNCSSATRGPCAVTSRPERQAASSYSPRPALKCVRDARRDMHRAPVPPAPPRSLSRAGQAARNHSSQAHQERDGRARPQDLLRAYRLAPGSPFETFPPLSLRVANRWRRCGAELWAMGPLDTAPRSEAVTRDHQATQDRRAQWYRDEARR